MFSFVQGNGSKKAQKHVVSYNYNTLQTMHIRAQVPNYAKVREPPINDHSSSIGHSVLPKYGLKVALCGAFCLIPCLRTVTRLFSPERIKSTACGDTGHKKQIY